MLVDAAVAARALECDEVIPCFQPLVELSTGKLAGFEVLARWNSPAHGPILPENFISICEQNGLIGELTSQVFRKAFRAAASLPEPVSLSVNISPIQLDDFSLPQQIRHAAEEAGFPLERLTIEVTETAILGDRARAREIAGQLKAMGCRLSLDDFGTGYSSLSNLQALPFDEVKIDRSFVGNMTAFRESRKIVAAIVALGQSLGVTTVAEGVETREQAEMLQRMGCDRVQGWLYGRPATADALPAILAHPSRAICVESSNRDNGMVVSSLDALGQLQAIYDNAPVGLCFLDRQYRHVTVNRQLAELTGIPCAGHLGKTVKEIAPHIFPLIEPYLIRALGGETITDVEVSEPEISPGDGIRTRLVSYLPARDEANDVIGVSIAIMDISRRKQAEEALRASHVKFHYMLELHPQASWTMDAVGNNLQVSAPAVQMAGFSEKVTQNLGWLEAVHPDDMEVAITVVSRAVSAGKAIDLQYRVADEEGEWRWMRSRGAPCLSLSGGIVSWSGCIEDIDAAKRTEEALSETEAQLRSLFDGMRGLPLRAIPHAPMMRPAA